MQIDGTIDGELTLDLIRLFIYERQLNVYIERVSWFFFVRCCLFNFFLFNAQINAE